jgi:CPA2 family monovalent cation:H+ antiporter-2
VRLLRYPARTGVLVGVALAQIGEFSFILAGLGRQLAILPDAAHNALVAASVVTITLNPLLFRRLEPWARRLGGETSTPDARRDRHDPHRPRAIVVGYGHVGQTIARLLLEHEIEPTIVELNHETVAALRAQGIDAVYGDATQAGVLESAGIESARSLVFAASGTPAKDVVQVAKTLNPRLQILARSTYLSEVSGSRDAGADLVVSAEAEVAFAMAEHLLRTLGATPEQIDRARDRLRGNEEPKAV